MSKIVKFVVMFVLLLISGCFETVPNPILATKAEGAFATAIDELNYYHSEKSFFIEEVNYVIAEISEASLPESTYVYSFFIKYRLDGSAIIRYGLISFTEFGSFVNDLDIIVMTEAAFKAEYSELVATYQLWEADESVLFAYSEGAISSNLIQETVSQLS